MQISQDSAHKSQALRKSPLGEKVVYEYFDTYRYLFVMYVNERYTKLY